MLHVVFADLDTARYVMALGSGPGTSPRGQIWVLVIGVGSWVGLGDLAIGSGLVTLH